MSSSESKRGSIRWWQVWRYAELKRKNERNLAQLVRHGPLTASDARLFMSMCKSGTRTPPWLCDRLIDSAARAQAAGEEME